MDNNSCVGSEFKLIGYVHRRDNKKQPKRKRRTRRGMEVKNNKKSADHRPIEDNRNETDPEIFVDFRDTESDGDSIYYSALEELDDMTEMICL